MLDERREKVVRAWGLDREVVLIGAGVPLGLPGGQDQTYRYRPHPDYFYLTEHRRPGSVLAFDPLEGWRHFVPRVTREEELWTGATPGDETGTEGLGDWLRERAGRPVAVLGAGVEVPGADGAVAGMGVAGPGDRVAGPGDRVAGPGDRVAVRGDEELSRRLEEQLLDVRRVKDDSQLERMRAAARATAAGHAALVGFLGPGVTERQLQIELEAAFFRAGGEATAYDSIVLAGARSAVLHGHPSASVQLHPGDVVLVDAGAEVDFYACDVTRTHCVGGFTGVGAELYALVLTAQQAAIEACRPGVEFSELHLGCCHRLAEGLKELGFLRGSAQELVERGAVDLFFPHGLGHLVGLGVRDASGASPGRKPFVTPGGTRIRLNMPLAEGCVVTIEPGLYFVRPLLAESRERLGDALNWDRVEAMLDFGGIRIEDNVLVRSRGPEILTDAIPS